MDIADINRQFQELSLNMRKGEDAFAGGDFQEAESRFKLALPVLLSAYGETHEDTQVCMDRLANCFFALHQYQEAMPLLRRLLAIKLRSSNYEGQDMAQLYFLLGRTCTRLARWDDAKEAFRIALTLSEKLYGWRSSFAAAVLEGFATCLKLENPNNEEANQLQEQARAVRASLVDQGMSGRLNKLDILARFAEGSATPTEKTSVAPIETPSDSEFQVPPKLTAELEHQRKTFSSLRNAPESRERNFWPIYAGIAVAIFLGAGITLSLSGNLERAKKMVDGFPWAFGLVNSSSKSAGDNPAAEDNISAALTYVTLDNQKQATIDDKEFSLITRGTKISGTCTLSGGKYYFEPQAQSIAYVFQKTPIGLTDSEGATLYPSDAPEWVIVNAMRRLAKATQRYYAHFHQYPSRLDAVLAGAPNLAYKNPFTGETTVPVPGRNLGNSTQSLDDLALDDYAQYQSGVSRLGLANDSVSLGPGAVEFYRVNYSGQGDSFYIRGTDRNGRLLSSSDPSHAYVIVLTQGQVTQ
jgi:tetratricopeptide (TPR) repeat protein